MGRNHRNTLFTALLAGLALAGQGGCGTPGPKPLTPTAFEPRTPRDVSTAAASVRAAAPQGPSQDNDPSLPRVLTVAAPTTEPAARLVRAEIPPVTTAPAESKAQHLPRDAGLYMTLGGVVAEVNGTPIYANTVVRLLDREFATKAQGMDQSTFREFARAELFRQRNELISDELEFAAAKRLLAPDDQKIAELLTMQYRQKTITESGGSVEMAKRKARAEGTDFEENVREQYRKFMRELFYQRRIFPRVQVTINDMRSFYVDNVDKLYSERAQAQFRVIKIDPKNLGGVDPKKSALEKINFIRAKAVRGDDFATLASVDNDDAYLKARGGDPGGWMQRDSYRIDAVERAVWKLEPGGISPVIESDGAYYLARVEAKKIGRVRPFDDASVQADVDGRLRQQQFAFLHDQVRNDLTSQQNVVTEDPARMDAALDIAMQKYEQWARR